MKRKRVCFRGLRSCIAVVLLMLALGIFGPEVSHLHVEVPVSVPSVTMPWSASGNSSPVTITYTSKPKPQL